MIINKENQVELEFGTGDICIAPAVFTENPSKGLIIFSNQSPRQLGFEGDIKAETQYNADDFPVIMTFTKKESIDVLVSMLLEVKELME